MYIIPVTGYNPTARKASHGRTLKMEYISIASHNTTQCKDFLDVMFSNKHFKNPPKTTEEFVDLINETIEKRCSLTKYFSMWQLRFASNLIAKWREADDCTFASTIGPYDMPMLMETGDRAIDFFTNGIFFRISEYIFVNTPEPQQKQVDFLSYIEEKKSWFAITAKYETYSNTERNQLNVNSGEGAPFFKNIKLSARKIFTNELLEIMKAKHGSENKATQVILEIIHEELKEQITYCEEKLLSGNNFLQMGLMIKKVLKVNDIP